MTHLLLYEFLKWYLRLFLHLLFILLQYKTCTRSKGTLQGHVYMHAWYVCVQLYMCLFVYKCELYMYVSLWVCICGCLCMRVCLCAMCMHVLVVYISAYHIQNVSIKRNFSAIRNFQKLNIFHKRNKKKNYECFFRTLKYKNWGVVIHTSSLHKPKFTNRVTRTKNNKHGVWYYSNAMTYTRWQHYSRLLHPPLTRWQGMSVVTACTIWTLPEPAVLAVFNSIQEVLANLQRKRQNILM